MNTRRHLMKLIGMSPIAATSAAAGLTEALSSPSAMAASAIFGAVGQTDMSNAPSPPRGESILGKVLFQEVRSLVSSLESEKYSLVKAAGLDADIAALKSCSFVYKANKQRHRDLETAILLQKAQNFIWS